MVFFVAFLSASVSDYGGSSHTHELYSGGCDSLAFRGECTGGAASAPGLDCFFDCDPFAGCETTWEPHAGLDADSGSRIRDETTKRGRQADRLTPPGLTLTAGNRLHCYAADYGFTTSTPQLTLPTLPAPSVASAVQVIRVPLPPESRTVIVSPANETTHE